MPTAAQKALLAMHSQGRPFSPSDFSVALSHAPSGPVSAGDNSAQSYAQYLASLSPFERLKEQAAVGFQHGLDAAGNDLQSASDAIGRTYPARFLKGTFNDKVLNAPENNKYVPAYSFLAGMARSGKDAAGDALPLVPGNNVSPNDAQGSFGDLLGKKLQFSNRFGAAAIQADVAGGYEQSAQPQLAQAARQYASGDVAGAKNTLKQVPGKIGDYAKAHAWDTAFALLPVALHAAGHFLPPKAASSAETASPAGADITDGGTFTPAANAASVPKSAVNPATGAQQFFSKTNSRQRP